MEINKNK